MNSVKRTTPKYRPLKFGVTRITLRPAITVRGDVTESRLAHLCEVAHRECFIANSLTTDIVVEPTFRFA